MRPHVQVGESKQSRAPPHMPCNRRLHIPAFLHHVHLQFFLCVPVLFGALLPLSAPTAAGEDLVSQSLRHPPSACRHGSAQERQQSFLKPHALQQTLWTLSCPSTNTSPQCRPCCHTPPKASSHSSRDRVNQTPNTVLSEDTHGTPCEPPHNTCLRNSSHQPE